MSDKQAARDPYFDNAKLILIFLVIFGHLIQPFVATHGVLEDVYYFIYTFHMPAFVLISGYFSKHYARKGYYRELVKKLLFPYICFQIIYSLFNVLINLDSRVHLSLFNPKWSLWFLLSMFFWQLLLLVFGNIQPVLGLFLAFSFGMLAGYADGIDSFLSLSRTIVFFPFFLLGFYATPAQFQRVRQRRMIFYGLAIFLLLGNIIRRLEQANKYWFFGSQPYDHFLENPEVGGVVRLLVYTMSLCAIFAFFTFVPRKRYVFTKWGQNTLYTYLLHGFVVKGLRSKGVASLPFNSWIFLIVILLSVVLTAGLSSVNWAKLFRTCWQTVRKVTRKSG